MEKNEIINKFLEDINLQKSKIAVVGDVVIDQFFTVKVNRISPEFPIEIYHSYDSEPSLTNPGGAANVVAQFKHFNSDVQLYSFLDPYTEQILKNSNIDTKNSLILSEPFKNPVKKRFYHGQFPLCRWDVEKEHYGVGNKLVEYQIELLNIYKNNTSDVVVLSDYDKGLFFNFPKHNLFSEDKIYIVDPKNKPIDKWCGCTIFKPNAKEAQDLSGIPFTNWKNQCDFFQKTLGCVSVVITHDGDGVYGKVLNRYFEYHSPCKTICESSIGAGDCFAAILGLAMANGLDIVDAVTVAYEAAAVLVSKKYNQPITANELLYRFDPIKSKIVNVDFLKNISKKEKLIFTNGVFDVGLTSGHIKYLQKAKSFGDKLVVALNSDESVRRLKGNERPIMSLEERMQILAGLQAVDYVISFEEDTPLELIKKITPNKIIKGGDYKPESVAGYGISEVVITDWFECISTSEKIKKIILNRV
jgi:D-beta-D-heptose 7-phosphate kinase/D-beta-D-heptose 1-phosphate adenosyltransferase